MGLGRSARRAAKPACLSGLSRLSCVLLFAGVMLAGCSDGGGRDLPPEWRGRDLEEPGWANATLQPGRGMGLEYVWSAGREVEWDWFVEAQGPRPGVLHYQVVRMEGGQGESIRSMFGNESVAGFTVIRSGAHQLLWRNESPSEVRFWYHVPEGHGGPRLYSSSEGPDCTFLLAGSVASLASACQAPRF